MMNLQWLQLHLLEVATNELAWLLPIPLCNRRVHWEVRLHVRRRCFLLGPLRCPLVFRLYHHELLLPRLHELEQAKVDERRICDEG